MLLCMDKVGHGSQDKVHVQGTIIDNNGTKQIVLGDIVVPFVIMLTLVLQTSHEL